MTSGVRPDSEEVIKQAYPTTVAGLANLDCPGLNRFLAISNDDLVSPPERGPGYDAFNGKYNEKGQRPSKKTQQKTKLKKYIIIFIFILTKYMLSSLLNCFAKT